jgi:hypothetical protein
MYVNAINTMTISWQNLGQGIQTLKTADMYGGLAQINTAKQYVLQGSQNLQQAHDYLFSTNWTMIALIGFCVLVVFGASGVWAGMLGKNDGRGFADYFCLGLFLGPVGLLIAWRKTRWGEAPTVYNQPRPGAQGGYQDPAYWPQPQAAYPEQAYAAPSTYAPWDSPPPQQGFSRAPSDTFATPYGTCPTCGAAIMVPDAVFCPSCGASV